MSWTTPEQLRDQLDRRWQRGEILAARLAGKPLFPLQLKLKKPSPREITSDFDRVRRWLQLLLEGSRARRGFGYEIRWQEVRHQVHGRNQLPEAITVPSEEDGLRLIGKLGEARRFSILAGETLQSFPELRNHLIRRPLTVLEHAAEWQRIMAVLEYFRAHPRPDLYLRQLDIAGVDTKFIENRRGLFTELLDCVLPAEAVDQQATGGKGFTRRYGLRQEPPLIRFRSLDPALTIAGLSDISVLPEEFARLRLPVSRVFITENKINGLAFPQVPGALVIFGLGYGLERFAEVEWLGKATIHYWGDIDTHGFGILHRLRSYLPQARSFLMDRETLLAHHQLWGEEEPGCRLDGELTRLTDPELALYQDLRQDRLAPRVRLEQERIGYRWVLDGISTLDYQVVG